MGCPQHLLISISLKDRAGRGQEIRREQVEYLVSATVSASLHLTAALPGRNHNYLYGTVEETEAQSARSEQAFRPRRSTPEPMPLRSTLDCVSRMRASFCGPHIKFTFNLFK